MEKTAAQNLSDHRIQQGESIPIKKGWYWGDKKCKRSFKRRAVRMMWRLNEGNLGFGILFWRNRKNTGNRSQLVYFWICCIRNTEELSEGQTSARVGHWNLTFQAMEVSGIRNRNNSISKTGTKVKWTVKVWCLINAEFQSLYKQLTVFECSCRNTQFQLSISA